MFQERESFHGKKERLALIDCKRCPKYTGELLNSMRCYQCFLDSLFKIKGKKFEKFSLESNNITISLRKEKINLFLECFKKIKEIKESYKIIDIKLNKKCIEKDKNCEIFTKFYLNIKPARIYFNNPLQLYTIVQLRYALIKKNDIKNMKCFRCRKEMLKNYECFLEMMNNLDLIKDYRAYCKRNKCYPAYTKYFHSLFDKSNSDDSTPKGQTQKPVERRDKLKLINTYEIGDYHLFKIFIYNVEKDREKLYEVNLVYASEEEEGLFRRITKDVRDFLIKAFKLDTMLTFEELIDKYLDEGISYLRSKYKLSKSEQERINLLATFEAINLAILFPFLIDDNIEEIFLDSSESYIYINHQTYGRCRTDIKLKTDEIERLKIFIKLYSGERLDHTNPSINFIMKNKYFFCRFTIDIAPIHASSFSFDIRKLKKSLLNIQDLLKNKTLNPLMAAFLYFNVLYQNNITATGKTDTGKTMLINTLDLLLPKEFQKIYIENAVESLNQNDFDKHQLKFKVDSLEDEVGIKYSKSNQIKKLLHRSPDIIYLGDVLTREEAKAMFHYLSAGLRSFQTIRANNIKSLMNRFIHHFKIEPSCFDDLDLVILMKRDSNSKTRKVIEIAEVNSDRSIDSLFTYNPQSDTWDSSNLFECKSIQKLTKHGKLDKEKFWRYLNIYKRIFEVFIKYNKISNKVLVEFFHDLASVGKIGVEKLEQFWGDWKRDCNIQI